MSFKLHVHKHGASQIISLLLDYHLNWLATLYICIYKQYKLNQVVGNDHQNLKIS